MGKSGLNVIALADKHRNPVWKPNWTESNQTKYCQSIVKITKPRITQTGKKRGGIKRKQYCV